MNWYRFAISDPAKASPSGRSKSKSISENGVVVDQIVAVVASIAVRAAVGEGVIVGTDCADILTGG